MERLQRARANVARATELEGSGEKQLPAPTPELIKRQLPAPREEPEVEEVGGPSRAPVMIPKEAVDWVDRLL